jgi:tetratricopeptide (TPR) repeat protein
MKSLFKICLVALSVGIMAGCRCGGCASRCSKDAKPDMEDLRVQVDEVRQEQGHAATVAFLQAELESPKWDECKPDIAMLLLGESVKVGALEETQDLYLSLALEYPAIADMGFRYVVSSGVFTNAIQARAWYESLLTSELQESVIVTVWHSLIGSFNARGDIAGIADRLDEVFELTDQRNIFNILNRAVSIAIHLDDVEGLKTVIAKLREHAPDQVDFQKLTAWSEARLLLMQGDLVAMHTYLRDHADSMGDDLTGRLVNLLLRASTDAGDSKLVDQVVDAAYASAEKRPETLVGVVRIIVQESISKRDVDAFLKKMTRAVDAGVDYNKLYMLLNRGFYQNIQSSNDETLGKLKELINRFIEEGDGVIEWNVQSCFQMLLDVAYYMQDFKQAKEIVERGIPGYDEDWHAEMLNKINAHLAMQDGRYEDAIKHFREHMARVEAWDNPMVNPSDGLSMTREMVLGFNEKRIGDVYSKMDGKRDEVIAAYKRARNWYNKALELLNDDSREYQLAKRELEAIPQE